MASIIHHPLLAAATANVPPRSSRSAGVVQLVKQGERGRGRDEVFVAALTLRAMEGPPQMLMSAAYSLNLWDMQHYVVILRRPPPPAQVFVFDFQPKDPGNIYVALTALSRKQVPGVILKRKLKKLPKTKCWFIGFCHADSLDMAEKFNDHWGTDLIIGEHDCRHYTNGLVEFLTGEQDVLRCLRAGQRWLVQ